MLYDIAFDRNSTHVIAGLASAVYYIHAPLTCAVTAGSSNLLDSCATGGSTTTITYLK
jgi:hypothetical protein